MCFFCTENKQPAAAARSARAISTGGGYRETEGGSISGSSAEKHKKAIVRVTKILHEKVLTFISVCAIMSSQRTVITMNSKEIVLELMKQQDLSYQRLSEKLGFKYASNVSERLRNGSKEMNVATLVKMLSALDCELVVRSTKKTKAEWIVTADSNTAE